MRLKFHDNYAFCLSSSLRFSISFLTRCGKVFPAKTTVRLFCSMVCNVKNGKLRALLLIADHSKADDTELSAGVIAELKSGYPDAVNWKHLKTYHISYALPNDDQVSN